MKLKLNSGISPLICHRCLQEHKSFKAVRPHGMLIQVASITEICEVAWVFAKSVLGRDRERICEFNQKYFANGLFTTVGI